ncbi:MAG: histidinol-phosphate transaminase [Halioglobus sp.]|nr:histidinol-phosphate transaminase [Halioglobus sp.]
MSRYWSKVTGVLTPYVPGEQPLDQRLVKLNTNESPYPPSPSVREAISSASDDDLRRYPDPESCALREAIAARNGLEPHSVFLGNGSDEVIALCFMSLLKHDLPLYFPDISYSFYPVWAGLFDVSYKKVPVCNDFTIDPSAYPTKSGGIIIPNPNAPTGILMSLESIRVLLERCRDSVVVIDEAYIDFGGESAAQLIPDFDNLLVVQTMSKSRSLAGLRVGFAMGDPALIEGLNRVKNSFNSYPLDVLAQRAALAAIGDEEYFAECCGRIVESRRKLTEGLLAKHFDVLPSHANFVFARHRDQSARLLFQGLREHGIIVRHFERDRIDNFLRISVGTDEANNALLGALDELLK